MFDLKSMTQAVKVRIAFIGHPKEPMNTAGPDWSKEIRLLDKVDVEIDLLQKYHDENIHEHQRLSMKLHNTAIELREVQEEIEKLNTALDNKEQQDV